MLPTVVCLIRSRPQAEHVIGRLTAAGIPIKDVSILMLPTEADPHPAPIGGLSFTHGQPGEKTTGAAATGGVAGAAAGIGLMSIVGLTPLLMIAPLVVATGAALGAGVGAVASGLTDFGIPHARQEYYQHRLSAGDLLMAVRSDDEKKLERAGSVFAENGEQGAELFRLTKKLE